LTTTPQKQGVSEGEKEEEVRTLRLTTDNFHDNLMFIACRLLPHTDSGDPGDHHQDHPQAV
jgi:hypothetical protein